MPVVYARDIVFARELCPCCDTKYINYASELCPLSNLVVYARDAGGVAPWGHYTGQQPALHALQLERPLRHLQYERRQIMA